VPGFLSLFVLVHGSSAFFCSFLDIFTVLVYGHCHKLSHSRRFFCAYSQLSLFLLRTFTAKSTAALVWFTFTLKMYKPARTPTSDNLCIYLQLNHKYETTSKVLYPKPRRICKKKINKWEMSEDIRYSYTEPLFSAKRIYWPYFIGVSLGS